MRRVAPYLLLLAAIGIAGFVWSTYQKQLAVQKRNKVAAPVLLDGTLNSKAEGFRYATSEGNRPVAELFAKDYREIKDPAHMELDQMELKLFHADGKSYDLVKAAKGDFYPAEGRLATQSQVEVQMAVPTEGEGNGRVLGIKAQGASLEIKTGKVFTQGAVEFRFHQEGGEGSGRGIGAEYDPQVKEIHLLHQAVLLWKPKDSKKPPMEVESDDVRYRESEAKVYLSPWAKMRKGDFTLEAAESEVNLEKGVIRHVLAHDARGVEKTPKRQVDYVAKTLNVDFNAEGVAEKVVAEDDARLNTKSDSGRINTSARRIDMFYRVEAKESLLEEALANGKAVVESIPPVRSGQQSETKILRSESIEMKMRPNGEDIQTVEVHAPGTLDFLPNRNTQKKRHLDGERMTIQYAAGNQIEVFRSVTVATRTEAEAATKKPTPPTLTWSKDLEARFDPKTGDLVRMEQWNDFKYQEGDRRAKAERAVQENAANRIILTGQARIWDPTGSTDANEIVLNQKTNEFVATGNVRSTREPEQKTKGDKEKKGEVTQATADRMEMRENNTKIRYEGNAVMWQGENRLRAARIDIDRKVQQLRGFGNITHQMVDENSGQAKKNGAPILTNVKAVEMFYSDVDRVVEYRGNVLMTRPGLEVKSNQLRAYLEPDDPERFNEQPSGGLEKAFGYGAVTIVETSPERIRRGKGETSEYYAADGRLVLEGGKPEMLDTAKGVEQRRATGKQLSWFANNDKIIVDGKEQQPTFSQVQKKATAKK